MANFATTLPYMIASSASPAWVQFSADLRTPAPAAPSRMIPRHHAAFGGGALPHDDSESFAGSVGQVNRSNTTASRGIDASADAGQHGSQAPEYTSQRHQDFHPSALVTRFQKNT